jgi:hypothetical protein
LEWEEDNKHIERVKNPRLIETGYQSPQLKLWTLGPDEWLLLTFVARLYGAEKTTEEAGGDPTPSSRFGREPKGGSHHNLRGEKVWVLFPLRKR